MQRLSRTLGRFGIVFLLVPVLLVSALLVAPGTAQARFRSDFCGALFNIVLFVPEISCDPPPTPRVTGIGISGPTQVTAGTPVRYAITTTTDTGELVLPAPTWTATGGTLAPNGPWLTWTAPTKVGTYTVSASYSSFSASQTVTVVAGPVAAVSLSPAGPVTVRAGETLTFAGAATDAYGNPVDAPTWSVTGVGGIKDGAFRSEQAGKATVTLKSGDKSATVEVTVAPGPAAKVTLTPAGEQRTETGAALQFAAAAVDAYGNPVDVPAAWTNSGVGAVTGGRFRATRPGTATVTAQIGGVSASSGTITVAPGLAPAGTAVAGGAPVRIDVTPTPAGAYVMAGPVLVEGSGTASISFPVGQAAGDTLLVYRYDARLQAWIAVPTVLAAGQATAQVPAGVPVALIWGGISEPTDTTVASDDAPILKVMSMELMQGHADGSFGVDELITRYQLAVALTRLKHLDTAHADLTLLARLADGAQIPAWARASVAASLQAGLLKGTDSGFAGEQTLTRAQLALVLARLLGPSATPVPAAGLRDVPAWAQAAVDRVVAAGLMPVAADGTFHAEAVVTRGELARVLAALVDQLAPQA